MDKNLVINTIKFPGIAKIYAIDNELKVTKYLSSSENSIDVWNFTPGVYILTVQTDNGSFIKKFIKL
jgi:hypothetical protein